jgi:Arc/MetJ-type ribon-helix-helix transcriptional regulator
MKSSVQARLDEETQAALDRLVRRHGLRPSEVIRQGIRLLDKHHSQPARPRLIGIGKFASGIGDLATNKKYMEGFGAKGHKRGSQR